MGKGEVERETESEERETETGNQSVTYHCFSFQFFILARGPSFSILPLPFPCESFFLYLPPTIEPAHIAVMSDDKTKNY